MESEDQTESKDRRIENSQKISYIEYCQIIKKNGLLGNRKVGSESKQLCCISAWNRQELSDSLKLCCTNA